LVTSVVLDLLYEHATKPALPAVGASVQVQWGSRHSYFPASVTKTEPGRIQILWQGYQPGQEEWVVSSQVKDAAPEYFHATGHAIFTLAIALAGGLVCVIGFGRPKKEREAGSSENRHGGGERSEASNKQS
jgi:hypothetical protein